MADDVSPWLADALAAEEPKEQVRRNVLTVTQTPDEVASDISLAEKVGQKPEIVSVYRDIMKTTEATERASRAADVPGLGEFIADPQNYAVASDDLDHLEWWQSMSPIEQMASTGQKVLDWLKKPVMPDLGKTPDTSGATLAAGAKFGKGIQRDFEIGQETQEISFLMRKKYGQMVGFDKLGEFTKGDESRLAVLQEKRATDQGPDIPFLSVTVQSTPAILDAFGDAGAKAMSNPGDVWESMTGEETPQMPTRPDEALFKTWAGVIAAGSAVTGLPEGFWTSFQEVEFGSQLAETEAMRVSDFIEGTTDNRRIVDIVGPKVLWDAAQEYGAWSATLEVLGVAALGRMVGVTEIPQKLLSAAGKDAIKESLKKKVMSEAAIRYGGVTLAGGVEEGLTEGSQRLASIAKRNDVLEQADIEAPSLEKDADSLVEAVWGGFQGGTVFAGVASTPHLAADIQAVQQAQRNQAMMEAMGDQAKSSKLLARLPKKYGEVVQAIRDASPDGIKSFPIDADVFARHFASQGVDPAAIAKELGLPDGALQQALDGGGVVEIPIGVYAEKLAATDHHKALIPHARIHPGKKTMLEIENEKLNGENFMKLAEQIRNETEDKQAHSISEGKVRDHLIQQMESASAYRPEIAQKMIELPVAFWTVQAHRMGVDPWEAYSQRQLRISGFLPGSIQQVPEDALPQAGRVSLQAQRYGSDIRDWMLDRADGKTETEIAADWSAETGKDLPVSVVSNSLSRAKKAVKARLDVGETKAAIAESMQVSEDVLDALFVDMPSKKLSVSIEVEKLLRLKDKMTYAQMAERIRAMGGEFESVTETSVRSLASRIRKRKITDATNPLVEATQRNGVLYQNRAKSAWVNGKRVMINPSFLEMRLMLMDVFNEQVRAAKEEGAALTEPTLNYIVSDEGTAYVWNSLQSDMTHETVASELKIDPTRATMGEVDQRQAMTAIDKAVAAQEAKKSDLPNAPLYQSPVFYSALQRAVETSKQAKAPAAQWKAVLQKTPGVKKEELEWTGVLDWLDAQEGSVTREALGEYLAANGVQVQEVVKGKAVYQIDDTERQRQQLALIEERDQMWRDRDAGRGNYLAQADFDARIREIEDSLMRLGRDFADGGATKWSSYTLPGGENYRELLLTLPEELTRKNEGPNDPVQRYQSSHWSEPNVLAHVRFDERTDASGKRTLLIHEVQSDWHQAGRERGYIRPKPDTTGFSAQKRGAVWDIIDQSGAVVGESSRAWPEAQQAIDDWAKMETEGVPNAPFKNNAWAALTMKRMVRWAAENGFDSVSWTPGQVQAERFGLEKQVEKLSWTRRADGNYDLSVKIQGSLKKFLNQSKAEMSSLLGSEIADRIHKDEGQPWTHGKLFDDAPDYVAHGELTGDGLKIGGEGMKAFYDRVLPNIANDIGKKYGAKVETSAVENPSKIRYAVEDRSGYGVLATNDRDAAYARAEKEGGVVKDLGEANQPVFTLPITDALRAAAMEGMPLFQGEAYKGYTAMPDYMRGLGNGETAMIRMGESADLSTFLHEFSHYALAVYQSIANEADAPAIIAQDMQAINEWLKSDASARIIAAEASQYAGKRITVADVQNAELANDPHIWRASHELFARTFETYLLEGKAPSSALRQAFAAFKAWLTQIYRSALRLNSNLAPEIRDVMDRMLATEDQIAEVRSQEQMQMMTREQFPGNDKQWAAYQEKAAAAMEAAESELRMVVMDAYVQQQRADWDRDKRRMRKTVMRDVDQSPARRAYDWLSRGVWMGDIERKNAKGEALEPGWGKVEPPADLPPMRLDTQAAEQDYGKELIDALPKELKPSSPEMVDAYMADIRRVKRILARKKPRTLAEYLRAGGGIKDESGEILAMMGAKKVMPGLINNEDGYSYDDAALIAWEARYFGAGPGRGALQQAAFAQVQFDSVKRWVERHSPPLSEDWAEMRARLDAELQAASEGVRGDIWTEARKDLARAYWQDAVNRARGYGSEEFARKASQAAIVAAENMLAVETRRMAMDANSPLFQSGVVNYPSQRYVNDMPAAVFAERIRENYPRDVRGMSLQEIIDWAGSNGMVRSDTALGDPFPKNTPLFQRGDAFQFKAPFAAEPVEVTEDLSQRVVARILNDQRRNQEVQGVRWLRANDGRVWVWDANKALHDQVAEQLGLRETYEQGVITDMRDFAIVKGDLSALLDAIDAQPGVLFQFGSDLDTQFGRAEWADSKAVRRFKGKKAQAGYSFEHYGDRIRVYFSPLEDEGAYSVSWDFGSVRDKGEEFDLSPTRSETGLAGKPQEAMGRIVAIVERFARDANPQVIEFVGLSNAHTRLYSRMLLAIQNEGWTAYDVTGPFDPRHQFALVKDGFDAKVAWPQAERLIEPISKQDIEAQWKRYMTAWKAQIADYANSFDETLLNAPLFQGAQWDSPEFKAWSRDHDIVQLGDRYEFESGKGVVVEGLHGTTADLEQFKREFANVESDLGAGFYFTNSVADAEANYAGFGPDLTNKIDRLAEQIANELDKDYRDPDVREEAMKRFAQHEGATLKVYVRFDNPVVIGGRGETVLDYNEAYNEELDEYGEPTGKLVEFMTALQEIASEERYGDTKPDELWAAIGDDAYDGIGVSKLIKALKESEALQYATDYETDQSDMAASEIIRRAFEAIGFDGFIDTTVAQKFGNMRGMDEDTVHFIAFKPTQIKSAIGNRGTFDPNDPNILFQRDDTGRPSISDFLQALRNDINNRDHYSENDNLEVQELMEAQRSIEWYEERGIIISNDAATIREMIQHYLNAQDEHSYHPDEIAGVFGFESGEALLKALIDLKPRMEAIETEVNRRMLEEYGDPFTDGTIAEEARLAAHAEAQARQIEIELEAIQRASGTKVAGAAAKGAAAARLQSMTIKQIRQSDWFLAAERRAASAAIVALESGDYREAAFHKQRQLLNFWLYRLARQETKKIDRAEQRFRDLANKDTIRRKIDQDYLDKIDALLDGYEIRKSAQGPKAQWDNQQLLAWVQEMEANGQGHLVAVDPRIIANAKKRPISTLSLDEFQGLKDTIANLEHLGRLKDKLLNAQEKRRFNELIDDLVTSIEKNGPVQKSRSKSYSPTPLEAIDERRRQAHAQLTRPEFLFRLMDGLEDNGPVWRALFLPFAQAEDVETRLMSDITQRIKDAFARYTPQERAKLFTVRYDMPYLAVDGRQAYTKAELLSIALNWGNEGNRTALIEGYGWTSENVDRSLMKLDERDWQVVQDIWAAVDSLWPEIARVNQELTGIVPEKVQPIKVFTKFGEIDGGYYPLKYDRSINEKVNQREEKKEVQELFGSNWVRPATRKGHTIERVGSGGLPVVLSLDVLTDHVRNAIHDIAFRKAVIDADRIIQDPRFQEAMINSVGREQLRQLRPWLQSIAADIVDPSTYWIKFLSQIRANTSIAAMGFKIGTATQQLTGLLNAIPRVGAGALGKGILKMYANPFKTGAMWGFIRQRSEFMRNRRTNFDRDVRDAMNTMKKEGALNDVRRFAFILVGEMDFVVSSSAWIAAYDNARAGKVANIDPVNEADAIAHADSVVRMTQTAGMPKDLPAVMRGAEGNKLFTAFYSFFSVLYNQLNNEQFAGAAMGKFSKAQFAANMLLLLFFAPVLAELLAGKLAPKDDEDWEDVLKREMAVVGLYYFSTIIGVRDLINAAGTGMDYQVSPVGSSLNAVAQTANAIGSGRADLGNEYTQKRATNAAGVLLGLPSGQAWITGDYVRDVAEGDEDPIAEPGRIITEGLLRDTR